jgi:transposase
VAGDDRPGNLPTRQRVAVVALLAGGSVAETAERANVSDRTVRRWLSSEPFQAALRSEGRAQAREATAHLFAAQREAVQALREALRAESPATRVRAARALLEVGLRHLSDDDDERIEALERRVEQWDHEMSGGSGWSVWSA